MAPCRTDQRRYLPDAECPISRPQAADAVLVARTRRVPMGPVRPADLPPAYSWAVPYWRHVRHGDDAPAAAPVKEQGRCKTAPALHPGMRPLSAQRIYMLSVGRTILRAQSPTTPPESRCRIQPNFASTPLSKSLVTDLSVASPTVEARMVRSSTWLSSLPRPVGSHAPHGGDVLRIGGLLPDSASWVPNAQGC